MVKYIKGDVLNCEATLVAHQVNAFGVMGGGHRGGNLAAADSGIPERLCGEMPPRCKASHNWSGWVASRFWTQNAKGWKSAICLRSIHPLLMER